MRNHTYFFLALMGCATLNPLAAYSGSYDKMWKKVAAFQQKDLPQSALKSAQTIFTKAVKEHNKGEMLRAFLYMTQTKASISADSLQPDIKRLERMTAESKDSVEKAVLHSLLGSLYSSIKYKGNYSKTNQTDFPEDISEWTYGMYVRKAHMHFSASLSNFALLSHTPMTDYLPVIESGNTDKYLGDNLLHVLGETAVFNLEGAKDSTYISNYYRNLIDYYTAEGNRNGVLLASLRKAGYEYTNGILSAKDYQKALQKLIAENPTAENGAEVYIALANCTELWENNRQKRLAFVRKGLAVFPRYWRINALKQIETNLLTPELTIREENIYSNDEQILPGRPFKLYFNWSNVGEATLNIYRIRKGWSDTMQQAFDKIDFDSDKYLIQQAAFIKSWTERKPFQTYTCKLNGNPAEKKDSVITMPALPAGCYLVEVKVPGIQEKTNKISLLSISSLRTIENEIVRNGREGTEIRIVDALSGRPVSDASAIFYSVKNENKHTTIHADKNGLVLIPQDVIRYRIVSPDDNYSATREIYLNDYAQPDTVSIVKGIELFTDRSIYRPGQTIKVAGIAYSQTKDKTAVETDKELTVQLRDANQKSVEEKKVTTNAYGSFSTEFTIPEGSLTGYYTVRADDDYLLRVRVEEYKRPTFDVTFEKLTTPYNAGDSISIVGTARSYTGVPIQNAQVSYTISPRRGYWRQNNMDVPQDISATTVTDNEGHFIVPVRLMKLPEISHMYFWWNYTIKAKITSSSGETQEGTLTLPLSNRSVYLTVNGLSDQEKMCKDDKKPVTFSVRSLQNEPVNCSGTYTITSQTTPDKIVSSGNFTSNKTDIAAILEKLPSGSYKLKAAIKDHVNGKDLEVTDTTNFVLYSRSDMKPPVPTDFWYDVVSNEISEGSYNSAPRWITSTVKGKKQSGWLWNDTAITKAGQIKVGTSLKDVLLFYRLYCGDKCIEDRQILLSDSIITFTYPYKPEYKNGLCASFTFVKDGKFYTKSTQLNVVQPDKKLSLAWETFRDKLTPGQKETWTLSVVRNDRQKTDAEVLASMYDASLDKFSKSWWNFSVQPWLWVDNNWSYNNIRRAFGTHFPTFYLRFSNKMAFEYPLLTYSHLTIYPSPFKEGGTIISELASFNPKQNNIRVAGYSMLSRKTSRMVAAPKLGITSNDASLSLSEVVVTSTSHSATATESSPVEPRTNFQETAFFYPHLTTNEEGRVTIAFTLPDALTRWNFRAVAHTKDMLTGVTDTTITASKDFMVQPNLPRFTRPGDVTSFPAMVTNLTAKDLKGQARMELLNPDNMQVIYTETQSFTLSGGTNRSLNFKWKATDNYPAVICRITAASGQKTDGEQNWVPVLANRTLVTESIPLAVNRQGTASYDLRSLFQHNDAQAKDRRLTVEFTSNPIWYAVQALPTMVEDNENDALSLSSAFYAQCLAQYIVSQYPQLRQIFHSWKQNGGNSESLWSNLQKNQELKTIILNETPWVAEAESESARKQRLSTLFDINTLTYSLQSTLKKLSALQQTDGGWSWYKGMNSSYYLTLSVATELARLEKLTGHKSEADALLTKALGYLDKKAGDFYTSLKKKKTESGSNRFILQTLYIHALRGTLKNDDCTRYFLDRWEKQPALLNNEEKAYYAIVLKAAGRTEAFENNLRSLLEHTVQTEELGRYFDNAMFRSFVWEDNRIPTQVLAIEALKSGKGYDQEINAMCQWLLKQKQTQAWASPALSAGCIYALLSDRSTQPLDNRMPAVLTLDGAPVKTDKSMAGAGYIHYTTISERHVSSPSTLTIRKTTDGTAWGGVYAVYTIPVEKIKAQGTQNTPLGIRRELYIERTENGRNTRYLLQNTTVRPGDYLISRLIVKTDRDLEFVQIKDGRASCAEPENNLSGYKWNKGTGYYEVPGDASTSLFCDRMNKGTYIFENRSYIDRSGSYTCSPATVQCAYAPEFTARTSSERIEVK